MVIAVVCACGDSKNAPVDTDAAVPDDGVTADAFEPDVPLPGHVDVYLLGIIPEVGTRVVFAAPDNTLIADVVTDASGKASAAMDAGYVTIVRPFPGTATAKIVTTIMGVKAGDSLKISSSAGQVNTVPPKATVNIPAGDDVTGWLHAPCVAQNAGIGVANPMDVDPEIRCRQNVGILARLHTPTDQFTYLGAQNLVAGTTYTLPAWQPTASTTYTLAVPATARFRFGASQYVLSDLGAYYTDDGALSNTTGGVTSLTATFDRPTIGDGLMYAGRMYRTDDTALGFQHVMHRVPAAATATIDIGARLARWFYQPAVQNSPPRMLYPTSGTDGAASATIGWLSFHYFSSGTSVRWEILDGGLPANGAYNFPKPPIGDLAFDGSDTVNTGVSPRVSVLTFTGGITYDELRPTIANEIDFTSHRIDSHYAIHQTAYYLMRAHANITSMQFSTSPE